MTNLPNASQRPAAVQQLLDRLKGMAPSTPTPRGGQLIFSLDATASREPTWDRACHIQGAMFEATAALGGLETQLVFYRGFNECKASRWVRSAAEMHRIMRSVACVGGYTQIERIFDHTLKASDADKINALIFVGDAMEEKIDVLCHRAGMLGTRGIPIFLFHEGDDPSVANAFKQLASLSGGAYLPFDLASLDRLRELLAAIAVFAVGGWQALEKHAAGRPEVLRITSQLKR